MASLHKIKRTRGMVYKIAYRLNGKNHSEYLPLGTTLPMAQAMLAEFNRRLASERIGQGRFISPLRDQVPTCTLIRFRDWFLSNKKTAIRRGRAVHPKTLKLYSFAFEMLLNLFGDVPANLDESQIRVFEDHLARYSTTSRSIFLRSLRAAWAYGIRAGMISTNPFKSIPITKERKIPGILTNDEKDRIFSRISNKEARLGFALARYAGLRRVEICRNVRWEDVDFDAGLLTIPEGKTGQNQVVPIIDPLAEILKAARQPSGYIVPIGEHTLTHYIERSRKEAGIQKPGAVRILRHSLAYGLLEQGIDIRVIQLLLRHSDISTTQIYTQIPSAKIRKMISGKNL